MNLVHKVLSKQKPWLKDSLADFFYRGHSCKLQRNHMDGTILGVLEFSDGKAASVNAYMLTDIRRVGLAQLGMGPFDPYQIVLKFNLPGDLLPVTPPDLLSGDDVYRDASYVRSCLMRMVDELILMIGER